VNPGRTGSLQRRKAKLEDAMAEIRTLEPHDPLPDGHSIVVMRRFDEDAPRETMIELIVTNPDRSEETARAMHPDGSTMSFEEAIGLAQERAAAEGLDAIWRIDRTQASAAPTCAIAATTARRAGFKASPWPCLALFVRRRHSALSRPDAPMPARSAAIVPMLLLLATAAPSLAQAPSPPARPLFGTAAAPDTTAAIADLKARLDRQDLKLEDEDKQINQFGTFVGLGAAGLGILIGFFGALITGVLIFFSISTKDAAVNAAKLEMKQAKDHRRQAGQQRSPGDYRRSAEIPRPGHPRQ
jgi:hypothetical protein